MKARFNSNDKHNNTLFCFSWESSHIHLLVTQAIATLVLRCSVWYFIPTNQYPILKNHTVLTSNEYTHNMYIIYIPELDISSLFLFLFRQNIFQILFQQFLSFLEEFINITCGTIHMTHNPKCVSQILTPFDSHFDVDHRHQMFGVLPNSIL